MTAEFDLELLEQWVQASLDTKYAAAIQSGDFIVGEVHPAAPARPVQVFASGMVVREITHRRNPVTDIREVKFHYDSNSVINLLYSPWYNLGDLILVLNLRKKDVSHV